MTSEWTITKLSNVAKIVGGGTPSTVIASYWDGVIPWITPKDLSGYKDMYISSGRRNISDLGLKESSTKIVPKGTVLFTSRAPIGYMAIASQPVCTNQGFKSLVLNESNDNRFFYYLLKHHAPEIEARAAGSTFKEISGTALGEFEIKIPNLKIQKNIANFLSLIDEQITLLRKTNLTLEAIARAIFKSWFVDFDPVRAKQEGRKPEGIDESIAALFPDSFENSELGEIPMGWEIKRLKDILDLFGGQAFKSEDYISQGIFVLRTNNFKQGIAIKNHNDVFLPNSFLDSFKNFVCEVFDYHLVMVGASIGNTGMILPHLLPALRNQNMWCFRAKNKKIISRLYTKFVVDKTSQELINFASGSARDFFKRDDFKNHKLITSTEEILKSYSKISNPILEKIAMNFNKIETLSNLRDALLPRLITGNLKLLGSEEIINNKTKVAS